MKGRLAIIGASTGQLPLCLKAREMGLETYCFAWPEGAVCKNYVDHFIPVSIMEMDEIVAYCKSAGIDGVVSNASETTALVSSYVADRLGKTGTSYETFRKIQDKSYVRAMTNCLPGLSAVEFKTGCLDEIANALERPYVLKPVKGASKRGVNFINDEVDLAEIQEDLHDSLFMAEAYVSGKEYSVECLSYHGHHRVIQITEKISSGPPHFVELEHHQPADLPQRIVANIGCAAADILNSIGYSDGASHIEIKIDDRGSIYLVEVNPRGGGDMISNQLIGLSTDYDFLGQLISVSLGKYTDIQPHNTACAGIYFLTASTSRLLPYFEKPAEGWMVERQRTSMELTESKSNYDHDGYIIYKSDKKIIL